MNLRLSFLLLAGGIAAAGGVLPSPAAEVAKPTEAPTAPASDSRLYAQRIERELRENILPFWIAHTVDRDHGGFYGEISNDLVVRKNAPRGALLTSRILWTYSAAYRRYHDPNYLEMARYAYRDLIDHFWDADHGGLFWSISAEGKPLRVEKQVYGQVFGIYALAEYYRVTQDVEALSHATRIYRLLEDHARDPALGGYFEVCARDWQRGEKTERSVTSGGPSGGEDHGAAEPRTSRPRSDVSGSRGSKSQNTHLHVLEAFTNLLRVWDDPGLRKSQSELVELMLTKITHPQTHHLILFMNDDWSPRGDDISFGHDIEASWLLIEAADVLGGDALRARVKAASLEMARVTREQAIDSDGSLLYEADPHGITNSTREWWPQAEAAVGFYNAYQLSGDERYRQAALNVWNYIDTHLVDHKNGEWFRAVTKEGVVSRAPKVSLWKCPYHNGRACLEMIERLEATP